MTDMPVDFSISLLGTAAGEMPFVRLTAKDGLFLKCQIDVSLADWPRAQFGEIVTAAYSTGRVP